MGGMADPAAVIGVGFLRVTTGAWQEEEEEGVLGAVEVVCLPGSGGEARGCRMSRLSGGREGGEDGRS